jgi:hypothetical protein
MDGLDGGSVFDLHLACGTLGGHHLCLRRIDAFE